MSEPEATPAAEPSASADAPAAPAFDPSLIRGLQVFASAGESPAEGADEAARQEALVQALAARAQRLAEAVDDSLTLANDGAIRWLGDPIGKLIAGAQPLEPRIALLADEALPQEGREVAERRLALWLAAHLAKALGPLIALADAEGAPEAARTIGQKVSQAFGVLERERVRAEVKALDQDARGALRKLGVRFGAHYIFIPALLKPGARTLCAQLWALTQSHVEPDAVERLLHFAASGRTSFAVEPPASPDLCRIAGFRLCGDRAVRVDIVERLSDLIRAALPRAPGAGSADEADGFVVTGQMTSLTGCSGEPFASILRSLGFVAHQVKKADHLAAVARRAAAVAVPAPVVAPAPAAEAASGEALPSEAATVNVEPTEGEASAAIEPASAETTAVEAEPDEAAPVEAAPAEEAAPAAEDVVAAAPESEAAAPPPPSEPLAEVGAEPLDQPVEVASEAGPSAEAVTSEAAPDGETAVEAAASDAAPAEEETIEVWRPAPRRPRHQPHHHQHRRAAPPPAEGQAQAPAEAPESREPRGGRNRWRDRPAPGGGERQASGEPRPEGRQGEGRRGPPPWRRDAAKPDNREDRRPERRPAEAQRPDKGKPRPPPVEPRVNLDSPFAKLLDLKPLLQGRDKKR